MGVLVEFVIDKSLQGAKRYRDLPEANSWNSLTIKCNDCSA